MKRLKVYTTHDGRYRFLVAASNQREACKLLRCTLYDLKNYGNTVDKSELVEVAMSEPGRLFRQRINSLAPDLWIAMSEGQP